MFSQKLTRSFAGGAAAVAVGIGAYAIVNSNSGSGASGTANAATFPHAGSNRPAGANQPNQPNQRVVGQVPPGWHSGSGTIITGAAANKAKAVAVAKYPGGTVNRVLKLSNGSYAVHMIKISWPHHVFVSKSFKVTGAIG
ncbi:MAG: hypothetical protein QOE36_2569 [Gaiellaceae bacterium]|jgi:hypothetical protein|nr:hypothetical protein [Gaiellaceae bacterium]